MFMAVRDVQIVATSLPTAQYYQSGPEVTGDWEELNLPLDRFKASGSLLRQTPKATSIKSVGVVAFCQDYNSDIQVRETTFY
jgi:hypothetical protein